MISTPSKYLPRKFAYCSVYENYRTPTGIVKSKLPRMVRNSSGPSVVAALHLWWQTSPVVAPFIVNVCVQNVSTP